MAICFNEKHAGFQKNCCFEWSEPLKTVAKILFSLYVYQVKCPNIQGYTIYIYWNILSKTRNNNIEHTVFHS